MANLHNEFGVFHDGITLAQDRIATLKHVREEIRHRISLYFLNLGIEVPEFRGQGSFAMMTGVNPLNEEYAIDDGVYLQHLDRHEGSGWRGWPLPEITHLWIVEAVRDHAEMEVVERKTYVRVVRAGHYHIDLRVYAELEGRLHLAECGARGWHRSDPLALINWFSGAIKREGEQLRRTIRYLKAWADFQRGRWGGMPSGLILSVHAVRNFIPDKRDDVALLHTFFSMESDLDALVYLLNPVQIEEELTASWTKEWKKEFQQAVRDASADAVKAVEIKDPRTAAKLWQNQLGHRFPSST